LTPFIISCIQASASHHTKTKLNLSIGTSNTSNISNITKAKTTTFGNFDKESVHNPAPAPAFLSLITSHDVPSIVSHNPALAHLVIVALFALPRSAPSGFYQTLPNSEPNIGRGSYPHQHGSSHPETLHYDSSNSFTPFDTDTPITNTFNVHDSDLRYDAYDSQDGQDGLTLGFPDSLGFPDFSNHLDLPTSSGHSIATLTRVLAHLTPTNPSLDVFGRLLQEVTPMPMPMPSSAGSSVPGPFTGSSSHTPASTSTSISTSTITTMTTITIANHIRTEALGPFITHAIDWIDAAAAEEQQGMVADDRVRRAVVNVSFFRVSGV
jgi:hypothetical protein